MATASPPPLPPGAARWALCELGEHRVEWQAESAASPPDGVAEKSGFVIEGLLRERLDVRGQWRDAWIGGLLSDDLARGHRSD